MPYAEHIRIVAGGRLGTNSPAPEQWSCSLSVDPGTLGMIDQTQVNLIHAAWATLIQSSRFATFVKHDYTKASLIGTDGLVIGAVLRHDATVAGNGDGFLHPFQVALVATLRTGLRGPSHRGRFYLPGPNVEVLATDGTISDAHRDTYFTEVGTMLDAVNTAVGSGRTLCVASSKGYNTPVTASQVGRVLDTQRRRRRSLAEDYLG